jgi:O-antigen/teichoic acid export membrane protein
VHLLYDDRYVNAGWMLSVLSCSLIWARGELYNSIYFALGQTKRLPIFSGIALLSLVTLVPLGHHLAGLQGAIWVMALRHLLALPVHYYFLAKHHLNRLQDDVFAALYWGIGALIGVGLSSVFQ